MEEELLEKMRNLKQEIEEQKKKAKKQEIEVEEIIYYGTIEIKEEKGKPVEKEIYLVKQTIEGIPQINFYADNQIMAKVKEEGQIEIVPEFADKIKEVEFLAKLEMAREQLQDKEPISLAELEQKEQEIGRKKAVGTKPKKKEKQEEKDEREDEQEEEPQKKQIDKNDIEIRMDAYITPDKKIADIIPEVKEKGCTKVKIRTTDNIHFKMYGIDKDGNEIQLKTLKQTEGTNPNQTMTKISHDGRSMEQVQVSSMLTIEPGKNESPRREGLGIKVGDFGIEEVLYYRRDTQNRYIGVPVGLETTNQKRNSREVQEFASKKYNTEVEDEITLIEEAAERCKISIEGFLEQYENAQGDTIQERIINTEEVINVQYNGIDISE